MDVSSGSAAPRPVRYKLIMNMLRRAFSFRHREATRDNTDSRCSLEMNSDGIVKQQPPSITSGSEIASTSRDSLSVTTDVPSVYEDPFVAILADGSILIKNYYSFNPKAEFRPEDIHLPHVRKLSRSIRLSRLRHIFYSRPTNDDNLESIKPWGITRNDVWWASHINRQHAGNCYYNVVLDDGATLKAGLSVASIEAFVDCLRCLGLSQNVCLTPCIPSPPINLCKIPFIDEVAEDKKNVYYHSLANTVLPW